ncbi:hypothetical protein DQ244_18505 [Blastococcus sp. TBT05-19]|nr:hypothetical protein DQ244_18505 [Blastococcus sp. TBT05-19]
MQWREPAGRPRARRRPSRAPRFRRSSVRRPSGSTVGARMRPRTLRRPRPPARRRPRWRRMAG